MFISTSQEQHTQLYSLSGSSLLLVPLTAPRSSILRKNFWKEKSFRRRTSPWRWLQLAGEGHPSATSASATSSRRNREREGCVRRCGRVEQAEDAPLPWHAPLTVHLHMVAVELRGLLRAAQQGTCWGAQRLGNSGGSGARLRGAQQAGRQAGRGRGGGERGKAGTPGKHGSLWDPPRLSAAAHLSTGSSS